MTRDYKHLVQTTRGTYRLWHTNQMYSIDLNSGDTKTVRKMLSSKQKDELYESAETDLTDTQYDLLKEPYKIFNLAFHDEISGKASAPPAPKPKKQPAAKPPRTPAPAPDVPPILTAPPELAADMLGTGPMGLTPTAAPKRKPAARTTRKPKAKTAAKKPKKPAKPKAKKTTATPKLTASQREYLTINGFVRVKRGGKYVTITG